MKNAYQRADLTVVALSAADIIGCSGTSTVTEAEPIILPIHPFQSST